MIHIDMELPKRCADCRFADKDSMGFTGTCNAVLDSPYIGFEINKRQGWCPLKEVVRICEIEHATDVAKTDVYSDVLTGINGRSKEGGRNINETTNHPV